MMKKIILGMICFLIANAEAGAQIPEFAVQDYHPTSPTAAQFLKYTEMPVSEFTGLANISVPIYQIQEDGIVIPVTLTYHAGGNRVSEEASWVGLGWDLSIGSIVQQINNEDDYTAYKLLQPDYQNSPIPTDLPFRYGWGTSCPNCNGAGWSNPYPIFSGPDQNYGYAIATDYYLPINGNFDDQTDGEGICGENPTGLYDSDPDIFRASFLGHDITFILNFKTGQIVVLNKPGYVVTRTNNTYEIVVPSGEQYYFQQYSTTTYVSNTLGQYGGQTANVAGTSSKVWMLTKIVTKHKKQILLNYTQTDTVDNYANYSERWDSATTAGGPSNQTACQSNPVFGFIGGPGLLGISRTYSYTTENRLFLSSIVFPNGQVAFNTSSRTDILGGQKLDSVQITTKAGLINTFRLNYSYFNSSGIGGNTYTPSNASEFGSMPNLRLELLSVKDNSGANYAFSYNPILLPSKNSLAQDFWGFYNGKLGNFSLIPNATRLNLPQMGNNGNNNSASPYYVQACMLSKIQYPTGGTDSMEYELNQFSNYWVPDSSSTSNTVSTGNGLRIHAIDYRAQGSVNAKRTLYTYSGGIDIVPLHLSSSYSINYDLISGSNMQITPYQISELYAKGFFSSNALASISGVGYAEVVEQDIAANGTTNGTTEKFFSDTADNVSNSGLYASEVAASLPATKIPSKPANGSLMMVLYYDNQNNLLRKVVNTYSNVVSNYYYGTRVFGYGDYTFSGVNQETCPGWTPSPQTLLGFYPIFDFETLLGGTVTTEYSGPDSLFISEGFNYDSYNQLVLNTKVDPTYYQQHIYEYPYSNSHYNDVASQQALLHDNRLSEIVFEEDYKGKYPYQNALVDSAIKHYMVAPDSAVLESSMSNYKNLLLPSPSPDSAHYDLYDSTYSNLLQFTVNTISNSLIWDYKGEYVTAEVNNAISTNIAYTSFEADGSGNWTIPDTTRDRFSGGITGSQAYKLTGSNSITKSGLNSGTTYIIGFWVDSSGVVSVNGSSTLATTKITLGTWAYKEAQIAATTSLTVSGTGAIIDELRLYPKGALMATYTYAPLIGTTSKCDPSGRLAYYTYDSIGRLKLIKDQYGNIIKRYDYEYQTTNQ